MASIASPSSGARLEKVTALPAGGDRFASLAELLRRVEEESSRLRMTEILCDAAVDLVTSHPRSLPAWLRLVSGQLAPPHEGVELGMGDVGLEASIALATGVGVDEVRTAHAAAGDLGVATARILSSLPSPAPPSTLSLDDVVAAGREVATVSGEGSVDRKAAIVAELLGHMSPLEGKYLVRVLQGSLRVGASQGTIVSALGRARLATTDGLGDAKAIRAVEAAARRAFAQAPDLGVLTEALLSGPALTAPARSQPRLGLPVQPMLHSPAADAAEALGKLAELPVACEYKYDGERVQVHVSRQRGHAAIFSRSCENITERFADVAREAPSWLADGVDEIIFEAEAVAFDRERLRILPFRQLARRPRKASATTSARRAGREAGKAASVCVYAFDVLSLHGDSMLDLPYPQRRERLAASLVPVPGHMAMAEGLDARSQADVEKAMALALAARCEGLMVKSLASDSVYEPGHRSLRNLKVKPDYDEGQADSFDLIPVGAWKGKGRRAGLYGAFLMASVDGKTGALEAVCKLGSGFTDEDLSRLTEAAQDMATSASRAALGNLPKSKQPDIWLEPRTVWEVRAAQISPSPTYPAALGLAVAGRGLALRFPRFVRERPDKRVADATQASFIADAFARQLCSSGEGSARPGAAPESTSSKPPGSAGAG